MDRSSSPIVLYLGDDDDDDDNNNNEQNSYFGIHQIIPRVSSSIEINSGHKKRKLPTSNSHPHTTVDNLFKRQRNDHLQHEPSSTTNDVDLDSELILLDPNDYIIEESDSQPFCSFDWTIQPQPISSPLVSTRVNTNAMTTRSRTSIVNENNTMKRSMDQSNTMPRTNPKERFGQPLLTKSNAMLPPPPRPILPSSKPTVSCARSTTQRGRPAKYSRIASVQSVRCHTSIRKFP